MGYKRGDKVIVVPFAPKGFDEICFTGLSGTFDKLTGIVGRVQGIWIRDHSDSVYDVCFEDLAPYDYKTFVVHEINLRPANANLHKPKATKPLVIKGGKINGI